MGIISKLKSIFKKNIDCSNELEDKFFHFYTTSGRKVNLGTQIVVKEGFVAVIVCKDKVTDVLYSGKHKIDNSTIPNTFKFLKLYKIDQNGKSPNSFKCDFYFINLNFQTDFPFNSDVPLIKKKDPLGRVEAYSEGVVNFKVDFPAKLVEYLLIDHAYIKDKAATVEIGLEIGNAVNKLLEKMNLNFEQMITNGEVVNSYLISKLANAFHFMGITLSALKVNSFEMPSKLQKKVNEFLQANENTGIQMFENMNIVLEDGTPVSLNKNNNEMMTSSVSEQNVMFENQTNFNPQNDHFFNQTQTTQKMCENCGGYIKITARYCEHCGSEQ